MSRIVRGGLIQATLCEPATSPVEKIKQAFVAAESFDDVSISDTRVGAVPNQVVFRLTYTVHQP